MSRRASYLAYALLTMGCTGETLSAGSNETSLASARTPTARATLSSRIDTFAMDDENLYFTTEDGSLSRLAKAGASPPTVLAAAAVQGSNHTEGLALDDDTLYWTASGDDVSTGAVLSVSKSGGTPVRLALNQSRPTGIAVDDTAVYWTNQGPPDPSANVNLAGMSIATIMSVPKAGGAATTLVANPEVPDALTLDETGVIWHEERAIRRVPKGGGVPVTLAEVAVPWGSSNLVVAGGTLYWGAQQGQWSVESVPLGGGAVVTLASAIAPPGAILLDGSSILWDVASGQLVGAIDTVPMVGGGEATQTAPPDVVSGSQAEEASFFLADATAFYWVEYWEAPQLTVVIRVLAR
jgi:hypothetical protein